MINVKEHLDLDSERIRNGVECCKSKSVGIVSSNRLLPRGLSSAGFPNLSKDTGNMDFYGEYSDIVTLFFLTGYELPFCEPNKTYLWLSDQQRPLIEIASL